MTYLNVLSLGAELAKCLGRCDHFSQTYLKLLLILVIKLSVLDFLKSLFCAFWASHFSRIPQVLGFNSPTCNSTYEHAMSQIIAECPVHLPLICYFFSIILLQLECSKPTFLLNMATRQIQKALFHLMFR